MNKEFAILSSIVCGGIGGASLTMIFTKSVIITFLVSLLCIIFMLYANRKIIWKNKFDK